MVYELDLLLYEQENSYYMNKYQMQAKLELDAKAILGEGTIWHPDENRLYWVDIEGQKLHVYNPETRTDIEFETNDRIGTVVPVASGGMLVALQNGIYYFDSSTGSFHFINNPLPEKNIRFNDGKCDPAGRFWVGSMHLSQTKGAAALYRMNSDSAIHEVLKEVTVSNGILWTLDKKTMFYIDSPLRRIDAFDYNDTTGAISNRRIIITIPDGLGDPDGMSIDIEGKLWVALWGGYCVCRFDPDTSELLQKIEVPAPNVASCAFGGKNLDILYISTAREGMSAKQLIEYPLSGGIFSAEPGISGLRANFFVGKISQL